MIACMFLAHATRCLYFIFTWKLSMWFCANKYNTKKLRHSTTADCLSCCRHFDERAEKDVVEFGLHPWSLDRVMCRGLVCRNRSNRQVWTTDVKRRIWWWWWWWWSVSNNNINDKDIDQHHIVLYTPISLVTRKYQRCNTCFTLNYSTLYRVKMCRYDE